MSQRRVTRFTCDADVCTDVLDVPSLTAGQAIVDAVEHGWTIDLREVGEDPHHYCPVHRSRSGWDYEADYPVTNSLESLLP